MPLWDFAPAAVFSGDDVQPLVEAIFNAPVLAIRTEHLLGIHLRRRTRRDEVLYFGFFGRFTGKVDAAGEVSGLLGEGKADASCADLEGRQGTLFGAAAVDFNGLSARRFVLRGKKRATDWNRAVARS